MSDHYLKRIEEKVDKLSEAVVELARIEERMVTIFKRLDSYDGVFNKFDERMDDIEKQSIARGQKIAFAERFFWMVCTGAVGLAFVYLR
tara:strand:- start:2956 stop:3222 length:267 start_codon:yes stop_codon:yes gene_type:complete